MDTEQYIVSHKLRDAVEECDGGLAAQDWLADTLFGVSFFCIAIVVTMATGYSGAFLILLASLPLIGAHRSQMLKSIGMGARLGVAALILISEIARYTFP